MNPRLPDLSYLSEEDRSQVHVNGWTTTVAKYEDKIEHTQSVLVYTGDSLNYTAAAKEKQLYFWHLYEQTYDCSVCDLTFGEVVKKHEEQTISSFGVPSAVMDSSLSGTETFSGGIVTRVHKDFSMSRKELARVEEKRARWSDGEQTTIRKETWNAAIYPPVPPDLEPLFPLAPDFKDYHCPGPCVGTCKHKRLTVQEAYEFHRNKYETSFPMNHTALADMLSYVSDQVPAEPCDEIAVEQKMKPWEVKLGKFEAIGVFLVFLALVLGPILLHIF